MKLAQSNKLFSSLIALGWFSPIVLGHAAGQEAPDTWRPDQLEARRGLEKRCGPQLARRQAKRTLDAMNSALAKRGIDEPDFVPRQSSNKDNLCMVVPESTQGPYHVLAEIVRQNMTEDQAGIPLEVQVDFIDFASCEPVPGVWVDMWHANATYGYYGHYIADTGAALAGNSTLTTNFPSPTPVNTLTFDAYSGADATAAASFLDTPINDASTWLRAVWKSDEQGRLTAYSIVPGWYTGRAQHFHIKVFPEGHIADNGTFIATGSAVHTGQFFFNNETLDAVAANPLYAANVIPWNETVSNDADMWYPYQAATGYDADMHITWVGEDITDGLVGSIVVALNMSFHSVELSTQYSDFNVTEYLEEGKLPFANTSAFA